MKIYTTANFIDKSNADGRRIGGGQRNPVTISPTRSLKAVVNSINGVVVAGENFVQILVPLEFNNNSVSAPVLQYFPENLLFDIQCRSMQTLSFSGTSNYET